MNYFLKLVTFIPCFVSLCTLFIGCSGETEMKDTAAMDTTAAAPEETETKTFYQVPAPGEVFSFMEDKKVKPKGPEILNPTANLVSYTDNRSKALNFGVYSTDLLYCSTFDYGNEAIKYFAAVKKLGDELGISSAIDEQSMNRIQANIGNNDSLTEISNDIYFKAFETLEQNEQGKTLALVIAGGWVESLYILTSIADTYSDNNPVIERVAEQKLTLDNLLEYLKKYEADAGVSATINDLNSLEEIYANLGEKSMGATTVKNKNGKRVLGGGTKITITQEQYAALVEKINSLRNTITGTKI